jgi:hypothetical protein
LRREGFYIAVWKIVAYLVQTVATTKAAVRMADFGSSHLSPQKGRRGWGNSLVTRRERQQGNVPGLLDGAGKAALVGGAHAGQAAGNNLTALGHKPLQETHIAIRDRVDLLGAKLAHFLAAEKLTPAAWSASGRTRTPPRAAALRWCARLGRLALNFVCHDRFPFSAL